MEATDWFRIGAIVVLLGISAFFNAAEIGVVATGRLKLRKLASEGSRSAVLLLQLLDKPTLLFATILMCITASNFVAESLSANLSGSLLGEKGYLVSFFVMTFAVIIFSEMTPIMLAVNDPERIARRVGVPVKLTTLLVFPFTWTFTVLARGVLRLMGIKSLKGFPANVSRDALEASVEAGAIRADEKELLSNVFEFHDTVAREIMCPRVDIVALPAQASAAEAFQLVLQSGHSRLPVYEGSIDKIIGVAYGKDLLPFLKERAAEADKTPITTLMRSPFFVPETERISHILREMRRRRQLLAIVVDEFGGTAGLVTLEDILEEIVGDIQDEFDSTEEEQLVQVGEGVYLADGLLPLHELKRQTDIDLPEDVVETVGGFVADRLQRLPQPGDKLEYANYLFEVLEMDAQRVARVRLTVLEPKEPSEAEDEADD